VPSEAPLILLEDGYKRWKIMEPFPRFGKPLAAGGSVTYADREERRYRTLCVVTDENMGEALDVLYRLETSRA
jgi:hypothetical protein